MNKKQVEEAINEVYYEVEREDEDALLAVFHPDEYIEKYDIPKDEMRSKDYWEGYEEGLGEALSYIEDIKEKLGIN